MNKCPCCEREFEQITDFPRVKIISAEIYDTKQIEIAAFAREVALLKLNDAVKKFSKTLEDAVGECMRVEKLLPDWVFSAGNIPGAENYKLVVDEALPKGTLRATNIILFKQDGKRSSTYKQLLKIGSIEYEGLVNH